MALVLICPGELIRGRIGVIALGNDRADALALLASVRWPPVRVEEQAGPSAEVGQALCQ